MALNFWTKFIFTKMMQVGHQVVILACYNQFSYYHNSCYFFTKMLHAKTPYCNLSIMHPILLLNWLLLPPYESHSSSEWGLTVNFPLVDSCLQRKSTALQCEYDSFIISYVYTYGHSKIWYSTFYDIQLALCFTEVLWLRVYVHFNFISR